MSATPDPDYAGLGRRLLAQGLDAILFGSLLVLLFSLVYGQAYWAGLGEPRPPGAAYGRFDNVIMLVPPLLTWAFWVWQRATPGKALLDCQVVRARDGRAIGWWQAVLRYLGYFLSALPLGLGFLWILWDRKCQGWHDKLARTVVIREPEFAKTLPLHRIDEALR